MTAVHPEPPRLQLNSDVPSAIFVQRGEPGEGRAFALPDNTFEEAQSGTVVTRFSIFRRGIIFILDTALLIFYWYFRWIEKKSACLTSLQGRSGKDVKSIVTFAIFAQFRMFCPAAPSSPRCSACDPSFFCGGDCRLMRALARLFRILSG